MLMELTDTEREAYMAGDDILTLNTTMPTRKVWGV